MKNENTVNVMNTLYIPLYSKYYTTKRNIILSDPTAVKIWEDNPVPLKGKSKNKYLAFFMSVRAKVFDDYVNEMISRYGDDLIIIHPGCGLDGRIGRVDSEGILWYDIDLEYVTTERKKYFTEDEYYKIIPSDVRELDMNIFPKGKTAVVIMEGLSMYIENEDVRNLFGKLSSHFEKLHILSDFYSVKAAKLSKYRNPINDVGVYDVYGLDDPYILENGVRFVREHSMVPEKYRNMIPGTEGFIFRHLYCSDFALSLYRIFEYEKA